jgi:hypothetical protein
MRQEGPSDPIPLDVPLTAFQLERYRCRYPVFV